MLAAGTQIAIADHHRERAWGLNPSTLVDRAAIASVSAETVCIQLALWASPEEPERRSLDAYDLRLVATGTPGGERDEPRVDNVRDWVERRNRRSFDPWTGMRHASTFSVEYRVRDLCFRNETLLDEHTETLSLVLRRNGRERRFSWRFSEDARYAAGANAGAGVHPRADDAVQAQMRRGGAYRSPSPYATRTPGGLTAYSVERTPGGHPVDVRQLESLSDARFGLLRQCLSREAERNPRLNRMRGRMTSEFTVGPSGVRNVRVLANDFTPGAAECMTRHLIGLPLPPDPLRWTSVFRYTVGMGPAAGANR